MYTPIRLESVAILKPREGKGTKEVQEIKFYREIHTAGREEEPSGERHSKEKQMPFVCPFLLARLCIFSRCRQRGNELPFDSRPEDSLG